jgi:hypothetical protein
VGFVVVATTYRVLDLMIGTIRVSHPSLFVLCAGQECMLGWDRWRIRFAS